MSKIDFDDENTWPKKGQLISFCEDPLNSTNWILAVFIERDAAYSNLATCILFRDRSDGQVSNRVHYRRLDTDLLPYDYRRSHNNPCNEIIFTPTNNIVNVIQTK